MEIGGAAPYGRRMIGDRPHILTLASARYLGPPGAVTDRFLVDGADAGGRMSVVEHRIPPRTLAAPVHRHTREDEYSYVLEGRMAAMLGDHEVSAQAGDLVFKPREQWHTFWNPGDEPARVLELISPAGLEELFRRLDALDAWPEPAALVALAGEYGCDLDLEATMPLAERHGLAF
jgi:mannose-6-phosphate isomerase-like protein (cupin superfamily)